MAFLCSKIIILMWWYTFEWWKKYCSVFILYLSFKKLQEYDFCCQVNDLPAYEYIHFWIVFQCYNVNLKNCQLKKSSNNKRMHFLMMLIVYVLCWLSVEFSWSIKNNAAMIYCNKLRGLAHADPRLAITCRYMYRNLSFIFMKQLSIPSV